MGKKLARFQLVTLLLFILSYPIDYLKDTDLLNLFMAYSLNKETYSGGTFIYAPMKIPKHTPLSRHQKERNTIYF